MMDKLPRELRDQIWRLTLVNGLNDHGHCTLDLILNQATNTWHRRQTHYWSYWRADDSRLNGRAFYSLQLVNSQINIETSGWLATHLMVTFTIPSVSPSEKNFDGIVLSPKAVHIEHLASRLRTFSMVRHALFAWPEPQLPGDMFIPHSFEISCRMTVPKKDEDYTMAWKHGHEHHRRHRSGETHRARINGIASRTIRAADAVFGEWIEGQVMRGAQLKSILQAFASEDKNMELARMSVEEI